MDWMELTPAERLVAQQAVLGYREVCQAAARAPHGRGLEFIERATLEQGRAQMRRVMQEVVETVSEAEKKGVIPARADGRRPTATPRRGRS